MKVCSDCLQWQLICANDRIRELTEEVNNADWIIHDDNKLFELLDRYLYTSEDGKVIYMDPIAANRNPADFSFMKRVVFCEMEGIDENV